MKRWTHVWSLLSIQPMNAEVIRYLISADWHTSSTLCPQSRGRAPLAQRYHTVILAGPGAEPLPATNFSS